MESHAKFAEQLGCDFPLLSDPDLAATNAYDVKLEMRGMTLAARATFAIGRDGKLAFADRKFPVPKTLEGTDLLKALDTLVVKEIDRRLEKVEAPEREQSRRFMLAVDAVARRDAAALETMLLQASPEAARKIIEETSLPTPRPSVLDLVDPSKILTQSDKAGIVHCSVKTGRKEPATITVVQKQTPKGWKVLSVTAK